MIIEREQQRIWLVVDRTRLMLGWFPESVSAVHFADELNEKGYRVTVEPWELTRIPDDGMDYAVHKSRILPISHP